MDRIIDFNEIKNKATDKDINKFEEYIYSLYYSVSTGQMTMADFSKKVMEYMEENNISQEKFLNLQKEFMKRYGFNTDDLEKEMKKMGIDISGTQLTQNYESERKFLSFKEKYRNKVEERKGVLFYTIKNEKNNIEIHLDKKEVLIQSYGSVDVKDLELNEFLCSYKKLLEEKPLKIRICENIIEYTY
ncbi:Protein of unknown function [Hathewaya proteolytica DSM 3090]|uniref:DUF3867 domain-containing protein n=1 Tax=Hathewaya proteolytica DSM 3090 TaxID=1121331 RepID=A0A1M6JE02_9CLOT|nr:DUF3867 domain-containing protein [Hathewaya proteolytica]SHJ44931.1 Protein of unknown function [Hathewaya proteolytica DSM 3090]